MIYPLEEDIFVALSVLLVGRAIIMKIFGLSFNFAFITVTPRSVFTLGITSLLYNIALNLLEFNS